MTQPSNDTFDTSSGSSPPAPQEPATVIPFRKPSGGGRKAESALFGLLVEAESMAYLVKEGFKVEWIPSEELRPVYQWAERQYKKSGEPPTVAMFHESNATGHPGTSWADLLAEYDVDIDDLPDESVHWVVEELQGRRLVAKTQEIQKRLARDLMEAPMDKRVDVLAGYVDRLNDLVEQWGGGEGRRLTLEAMSTVGVDQTDWLWEINPTEGRIPLGELTIFGGREGLGKSTLTSWIAAQVTKGTLPGDFYRKPRGVIIVAAEDSYERTIIPRLMASGADLDRVFRVDVQADELVTTLNLPADLKTLERYVAEEDIGLVIIDPLTSALEETADLNSYGTVTNALWPIAEMARRNRIALLGIVHLNKSPSKDAGNIIIGSRAFNSVARATIMVIKHPEDEGRLLLSQAKNNLGRMDLEALTCQIAGRKVADGRTKDIFGTFPEWGDNDPRFVSELLEASGKTAKDESPREVAKMWLRLKLSDGPTLATEVRAEADEAGIKDKTLRNAKDDLNVITERVEGAYPPQFTWGLPEDG